MEFLALTGISMIVKLLVVLMISNFNNYRYIRIWDFESGDQIFCIKGSQDGIYDVKFSPCGKFFAFTNIKSINYWSLRSRKEICNL